MILRTWKGRTRKSHADAYQQVIKATGVPGLAGTPGNRGVWILRRVTDDEAEFIVVSRWESLEDIRAFAGDDVEKAVYYPEDDAYLLDRSEHVIHYEVAYDLEAAR